MKKLLLFVFAFSLLAVDSYSQSKSYIRPAALGISFNLVDYTTAERIRNTSLTSVLNNKQAAEIREMSPGISLSYFQGLTNHIDFAGSVLGAFAQVDLPNNNGTGDEFLFEADASVNLKMFSDQYFFTPYLSAGVGFSSYNKQKGAFIPLGGGLKFNLFNEAAVYITTQYRVPLNTETGGYHFVHGIGISGILGKKKSAAEVDTQLQ
jgi:hypothetical protein